jgi:CHASE2 domain-containing sensor protein
VAFVDNSIYGKIDDLYFQNVIAKIKKTSDQKLILPFQFDDRLEKTIDPVFVGNDIGFANIFVDRDGVVRDFRPYIKDKPSFSVSLSGLEEKLPEILKIDYVGKAKTFPNIPFIDVYNGKISKDFFKDKIVLIGATSPDLHDFFHTPFGIISGVEIQANILQTVLSGNFFKNTPASLSFILICIFSIIPILIIKKIRSFFKTIFFLFCIFVFINIFTIICFSI